MRLLLLFFISFYSFSLMGQIIPYATQQPKWVFPIYAQDATGKRDTIYLGYHPGSNYWATYETSLGEIWFPGVSDFSLSTYYWILPTDSCIKVDIKDTSNGGYFPVYEVWLSNVILPVTFKWDVSLLRSDSIPFPDQDPLPRAQIRIERPAGAWGVDGLGICGGFDPPIIVSDTIDTTLCYCHVKDSIKFIHPFGDTSPQTFPLFFYFEWWEGHQPGIGIAEKNKPVFKIFPNPAKENLNIYGMKSSDEYHAVIYNSQLAVSKTIQRLSEDRPIDISMLKPGIYFLLIQNENLTQNQLIKIVKL